MFLAKPVPLYVFVAELAALVIRIAMGVRHHKILPMVLWNVAYEVASGFTFLRVLGVEFFAEVLTYELWVASMVFTLCCSAIWDTQADARLEVQASALRSESSGLWSLLELICDVVVPLDDRLRVSEQALRLGALLTMQGKSLQGTRLQDVAALARSLGRSRSGRHSLVTCWGPALWRTLRKSDN